MLGVLVSDASILGVLDALKLDIKATMHPPIMSKPPHVRASENDGGALKRNTRV